MNALAERLADWGLDPLLARFIPVLAAVLVVAGVLVAVAWPLLRGKPALRKEIALRYAAWVGIAVALCVALALGRVAWIAAVALLSILAFREYARAVGLWRDWGFQGVVHLFIVLLAAAAWWPYEDDYPEPGWYGIFMVLPLYGILALVLVPIVRDRYDKVLQRLSLSILGLVFLSFFLAHFAYLRNFDGGVGMVLFVGMLVATNDVAAFITGRFLGRHKLRPTLSPGKTVEGAMGGLAAVLAVAWGLRWLVPMFGPVHLAVVAALISVAGVVGDLAMSTIKRDLGIKDWSDALPGHGGILDRVNSLMLAAPVFLHYMRYVYL
ncbi:MAG: phosphatidate cytidylyltransferase [Thermoplasmatota archaeon]